MIANSPNSPISLLGIALVASIIMGKISHRLKVPQVIGYLLTGIIMGPSLLNLFNDGNLKNFHSLQELGFGLILFNIGGEFHRGLFQKLTWTHIRYSLVFSLFTFIIVSAICFGFAYFSDMNMNYKLAFSLYLGVTAIAAAPPTTLLVIKECDAKGPLTHTVTVHLAIGTLISLVGAFLLLIVFRQLGIWQGTEGPVTLLSSIASFLINIFGALIVGTIIGFIISYYEQKERNSYEILLAVICGILLGQSLAHIFKLDPLLLSLFTGISVANSSCAGDKIHSQIKGVGLSIFAIFFLLAGAHIHIQHNLSVIGSLGLGYILARTVGLIVSARYATKFAGEQARIGNYMGLAVLSHAGAAIAIVSKLAGQDDPASISITYVVMASIFVFEIIGPFALKYALKKMDEYDSESQNDNWVGANDVGIRDLIRNFLQNIGVSGPLQYHELQEIRSLVKKDVVPLKSNLKIDEITDFIEQKSFSIYPVVNRSDRFIGVLELQALKNAIMTKNRKKTLRARKLIGTRFYLTEEMTILGAQSAFDHHQTEFLPVIDNDSFKFIGVLSYKDLLTALDGKKS